MSKAYVEIDFFRRETRKDASCKPSSPESASSPFRGIQGVVSRINPQLLRTVVAAEHARCLDTIPACPTSSNSPSPCRTASFPALPVYKPASRCHASPPMGTSPMTIFYNGTVTTFDVPHDKAEVIMRMAETRIAGHPAERSEDSMSEGNQVVGYLPIERTKSLQRFFEKRTERLASASPYRNSKPNPSRPL
ncbi:hypothetical protein Taro_015932 [Colocasia esculenta]|uniref:Protein TIFY n=1 Tax=Colocasia esculenta TaxID=4460 RepID=A0A843UJ91_COLES|nr:hypothetical protein [Colocasia esculenta]